MRYALVIVALLCGGCSSLWHFSDPTVEDAVGEACEILASRNIGILEIEAQRRGMRVDQVVEIFKGACKIRMAAELEQAKHAGFAASRGQPVEPVNP